MAVLDDLREQWKDDPDYHLEEVLLELTEQIGYRMTEMKISKAELARRTGKKPAQISAILSGQRNITLKTIVQMAMALDLRLSCKLSDAAEHVELASLSESLHQATARQKKSLSVYTSALPVSTNTHFDFVGLADIKHDPFPVDQIVIFADVLSVPSSSTGPRLKKAS